MSYPARGTAERGAGAPLAGMRRRSRPRGAHPAVSIERYRDSTPEGPFRWLAARPALAGIDGKAIAARRRREIMGVPTPTEEAA